jgi:metal-responsive CopG/Arc/MetJ family transcriptional regulator
MPQASARKVTLSLPEELIAYADSKAAQMGTNRSRLVSDLLERSRRRHEKDDLAKEGYRFYAKEAEEFAAQSAAAVGEAFDEDGPAW